MSQKNILNELNLNGIISYRENDDIANKLFYDFGVHCLKLLKDNKLNDLGDCEIRAGADEGMVEIRINENNIPLFFQDIYFNTKNKFESICNSYLGSNREIIGKIYINHGVIKTRGAHSDGTVLQLKKFVYCTDVSIEDGPYSYQVQSHNISIKKIISFLIYKLFTKTDPNTYLFRDKCTPFIGDAGTTLISDQRGLHKGIPQTDSKRFRVVLVFDSGH